MSMVCHSCLVHTYIYNYVSFASVPHSMQAQGASASIKAKLVYRDEEELDTGLQKVQPLPFLGIM